YPSRADPTVRAGCAVGAGKRMKNASNKRPLFRLRDRPQVEPTGENPFLMLSGSPSAIPDLNLIMPLDRPPAGIVLLERIEENVLAAIIDQLPDPALPIADFGGNRELRRDFAGDAFDGSSIAELKQRFAPIWSKLDELPFRAAPDDRAELTILRLAYSRDTV